MSRRDFGRTWWGRAWVDALEGRARLDPNRLPRGRTYARHSRVAPLTVAPGEIRAAVQGRRVRPYGVRVRVRTFTAAEWDALLDAVAGRAAHAAALLDGELPPELVDDAAGAGVELLPGPGELQPRCTCPDWADPCKHAAAVCYLVAHTLDADPFALLLLRGRSRDEVIATLRTRRAAAHADEAPAVPRPHDGERDEGVPARDVWKAADRPPLPAVPPLPERPGRPAVLAVDPPPGTGLRSDGLQALALDATRRAFDLAAGLSDGGLALDTETDLARRAARLLGLTGFPELARRAEVPARRLAALALAWQYGGAAGVEALVAPPWPAPGDDVAEARATLAPHGPVRVSGNRVTAGGIQLRLGRDGCWWRLERRRGGQWEVVSPSDADPQALA